MIDIKKIWLNSLSFLDNQYIYASLLIILFLYSTLLFQNINTYIGNFYKYTFFRLFILLLIIYIAPKDITLAIFLAVTYLLSINEIPEENEHFDNGTVASDMIKGYLDTISNSAKAPNLQKMINNNVDMIKAGAKNMSNSLNEHPNFVDNMARQMAKNKNENFESDIDDIEQFEDYELEQFEDDTDDVDDADELEQFENDGDELEQFEDGNSLEDFKLNEKNNCKSFYVPKFESINDVCNAVTTFNNNSYNTQGIDNIMGFEKWNIKGSQF